MCDVSDILKCVLFVAYTNLFALEFNLKQLGDVVNEESVKIKAWFRVNNVSFNICKTNFMIFSKKHLANNSTTNDCINIVQVFETKCNYRK